MGSKQSGCSTRDQKEEGYFVYDSGSEKDIWILTADGKPFVGDVWPGPCVFPDFTQSSARSWWANLVKDFIANGVDGIWNDMNEPAVFKVYGMLMARSTYEGMKLANGQKRPFVLARAGFVGSQRYAATWTGDNISTWEHLHMSISMVVQLGLSGQPFSGPDIGGFAGNATPKLFGRWMGLGAMFPFCRGHSETDTIDHEPWSFGEECEEVCRLALRRRYRLLSHLYTLFYMAHTRGIPVATPTFFAGKAKGFLFEDDGDGYEYTRGNYLLTTYIAEQQSSMVTVKVSKPKDLGRGQIVVYMCNYCLAKIDAWGTDGEILQIPMPSESEVSDLVLASEKKFRIRLDHIQSKGRFLPSETLISLVLITESAKRIPDVDNVSGHKGTELSRTPVELKSGDWALKVVPWIGGRVISMEHLPSGTQWLHSRVDVNGYEEYSGMEDRSAGCSEEYSVVERDLEPAGEVESLQLEGDIGGGLILERQIYIPKENTKVLRIDSGIVARNVGAGSGGFSRLVCLRVHPMFNLQHPTESYVSFTAIDGSKNEVWPESGEQVFEGDLLPNGEWSLVNKSLGLALVNRFNVTQVHKCVIHWGTDTVSLELWSEERPVSKETPLKISHEYERSSRSTLLADINATDVVKRSAAQGPFFTEQIHNDPIHLIHTNKLS
ncbi:hypothetical protein DH2020_036298 [Rehmannia glutinosa]|uniref:Alpha-glucosidase n=1 Tax=Rehmannia glutinosa TaxID=99300 RepID=A0ABR0V6Q4_REHGL